MKNAMRAITLVAVTAISGAAVAADMSMGPRPYYAAPVRGYNWGGFYAGANLGYEWGSVTHSSVDPNGILGGIGAGYNWQSGDFVFGGETDIQATDADDTFAPYKFSNPWFGTLRGRAGYALNNILFYGTFGLAYGGLTGDLNGLDESKTHIGWAGGFGMEVGLSPRWSAKVEYLYMDLTDRGYSITGADNGLETNMLRFGINYHF